MRRVVAFVMVPFLAAVLTGCGSDKDSGTSTGTTVGSTTTAPGGGATPTTAATTTTTAGGPTTTDLPKPTATDPVNKTRQATVPPAARLIGIDSAAHDGFDRVVFRFAGDLPGQEKVEYVSQIVQDGSGDPVRLEGSAFLRVIFSVAQAHDDSGQSVLPDGSFGKPGLTTLKEIASAGDFEGIVTIGLGLGSKVGFRVFELSSPSRVVIDVAHA